MYQTCECSNVVYDSEIGETCCTSCGTVKPQVVDDGGPVVTAWGEAGCALIPNKNKRDYKLVKAERFYTDNRTIRDIHLESDVKRLAQELHIPGHVTRRALILLQVANRNKIWRGRKKECIIGAIVFAACREAGIPRSIADISSVMHVERRYIFKYYKLFEPEINRPVSVSALIPSIISKYVALFKLNQRTAQKAYNLHEYITSRAGPAPTPKHTQAHVAALVSFVAKHTEPEFFMRQDAMAVVAGTNPVTIKNRTRDISEAAVNFKWDCTNTNSDIDTEGHSTIAIATTKLCPMAIQQMNHGAV